MEDRNNDFIKVIKHPKNFDFDANPTEEPEEFFPDDHEEELAMFFDEDYTLVDTYLDNELDVNQLSEEQKELYKKITDFYQKKLEGSRETITYCQIPYNEEEENKVPENEPLGKIMVYPHIEHGLGLIVTKDRKTKVEKLRNVYPFLEKGHEYKCKLQNVLIGYYRQEAQLVAFIDEYENLMITFYDKHYIANRFLYNKDDSYIFNINALAYSVEIINNDNMICVSPTYDIDSEHYEIDTIVNRVSIYDEFVNEQKVWQLDVVIGYTPDGDEIPLVVYFTKKSLNGNPIPQKGDNVHLSVSIQGSLVAINKELSKPFILSI